MRMSIFLNFLKVSSITLLQSPVLDTSATIPSTSVFSLRTFSAFFTSVEVREQTTILQPSSANAFAMANPIPRDPPVTIATLPVRLLSDFEKFTMGEEKAYRIKEIGRAHV